VSGSRALPSLAAPTGGSRPPSAAEACVVAAERARSGRRGERWQRAIDTSLDADNEGGGGGLDARTYDSAALDGCCCVDRAVS